MDGARISLHFRSARRPAARDETQQAGTPSDGEAVGPLFAHVMADNQDRMGMERDLRGTEFAVCKIAGIADEGRPLLFPRSVFG